MTTSPIIIALDYPTAEEATALAARLDPTLCRLKIGKELFTRAGPGLIEILQARGYEIFLDLKFHDIPNTVAAACRAAAELGVWMMDVHASGGQRMLMAARDALSGYSPRPLLVGVTVLTSLEQEDLASLGWRESPEQLVLRLARLARSADLDGLVCSAREAGLLRRELGPDPLLVTPGIRLDPTSADDQRRTMAPAAALAAGASHLVIGRPVTRAADPLGVLKTIVKICSETP